jgi:hypothetical protein
MSHHRSRTTAVADLATALYDHAAGIDAHTAAINLIISHGIFLTRPEFEHEFVRVARCHPTCAYIRWGAAVTALNQHRLPCSTSEAGVLRIAASLGGDVPVRLRRVLGRFDHANIPRITDAITLANGTQPHRCF